MENHYLLINQSTNIVENVVVWDGTTDWTPPEGYIIKFVGDVKSRVWELDKTTNDFVLGTTEIGPSGIGSTWDGTYTIPPKPEVIKANTQPSSTGTNNF